MADNHRLTELRERYIELTKLYFKETDTGKSAEELQQLQQEIENTLLQIDELESQPPPSK